MSLTSPTDQAQILNLPFNAGRHRDPDARAAEQQRRLRRGDRVSGRRGRRRFRCGSRSNLTCQDGHGLRPCPSCFAFPRKNFPATSFPR